MNTLLKRKSNSIQACSASDRPRFPSVTLISELRPRSRYLVSDKNRKSIRLAVGFEVYREEYNVNFLSFSPYYHQIPSCSSVG